MQFKHPELLYALFLLLIPLIVHLFQLRRFKRIPFTNVAFLKQVVLNTRKSSQVKKWLTLLLRTLALACVILAFAQPYFLAQPERSAKEEVILYLDNSFSMQAKGPQGALLQRAIQDIYEFGEVNESFTWFTNNNVYNATSLLELQEDLLTVTPTYTQLSLNEVVLKADQLFAKNPELNKRLIVVSDLQQQSLKPLNIPDNIKLEGVHLEAIRRSNISIDSSFINAPSRGNAQLIVSLSAQEESDSSFPVSFYNGKSLIAKSAVDFSEGLSQEVQFPLELDNPLNGSVQINDEQLQFDNALYFNIRQPERIKVAAINQNSDEFIAKLYPIDEFEFTAYPSNAVDYNQLISNNLIILNELDAIPNALQNALNAFLEQGGSLLIIPGQAINSTSYNQLLGTLGMGQLTNLQAYQRNIAEIVFGHPVYTDVFDKNVTNFQYPQVESYYGYNGTTNNALLLEGGRPFLTQQGNVFLFTAALNENNSNFSNSPLIVPTFYNIARFSLPLPELYYPLGRENTIGIPASLGSEEIVSIANNEQEWIPIQQAYANSVQLTTSEIPPNAGTYLLKTNKNDTLGSLSFNFPRNENANQFYKPQDLESVTWRDSLPELFKIIANESNITTYWKWLLMGAVLFLVLEMFVLRFFK